MGIFDKFKKKKQQDAVPETEVRQEEQEPMDNRRFEDWMGGDDDRDDEPREEQNLNDSGSFGGYNEPDDFNPFAGTEQRIDTEPVKKESRTGKRLRGGLVAGIVAAIAMVTVGYTAYNFLKPKAPPQLAKKDPVPTAGIGATPGSTLPGSYSDLAKYEKEQKQKQREELIKAGKLNPAREQRQAFEAKQKAQREAKQQAERRQQQEAASRTPSVTPPSRPSMPGYSGGAQRQMGAKVDPYAEYKTPVGFQVTESGKVDGGGSNAIFTALPGTSQATGKKYTLHTGTVIPVTLLTGMTSDSKVAGVTAQVRQDVYDSLTGTHLLIPQGSKVVGTGGGTSGRRMNANFTRIILPNGASIRLSGPHATDSMGYTGLRDKYDEKWGPAIKGAFLAGIFTGIADWVGDIDTKTTAGGGVVESAWGNVAEKISDRLGDKAEALDKNEKPAVIIRPGFQFHVYLTEDVAIYQYQPLKGEPR